MTCGESREEIDATHEDLLLMPMETQLSLPAPITGHLNVEWQGLVSRNPLQSHIEAFYERATFVAECQVLYQESESVDALESALREVIDAQHDARIIKESMQGDVHTIHAVAEGRKRDYRDLADVDRYGESPPYEEFKRRVFGLQFPEEDYPGTTSFFRHGGGGGEELTYRIKRTLKCPITMTLFQHPVRSKVCVHVFSRDAVMEMIQRNRGAIDCPVAGCDHVLTKDTLERDRVMERRVREQEEEEERNGEVLSSENGEEDVLDIL